MSRILLAVVACAALAFPAIVRADDKAMYFRIVQPSTGKVLSIENDSEEGGARVVVVKPDEKNLGQQWQLDKDNGYYKITNRKTGKVMDVYENSNDEGTPIIQWDEKGDDNDNQRWSWVGDGDERRLKSKSSGLVLDVDSDGKVLQKQANEKNKAQLWKLIPVK